MKRSKFIGLALATSFFALPLASMAQNATEGSSGTGSATTESGELVRPVMLNIDLTEPELRPSAISEPGEDKEPATTSAVPAPRGTVAPSTQTPTSGVKPRVNSKIEEGEMPPVAEPAPAGTIDRDDDSDNVPSKEEDSLKAGISVSREKLRDLDETQKNELRGKAKSADDVVTTEDFKSLASSVVADDERMEEVSLNFEKMTVKYQSSGKLFGLFHRSFTEVIEVTQNDTDTPSVKVRLPWYGFLMTKDIPTKDIEAAVKGKKKSQPINMDAISWGVSNSARILTALSTTLKTKFDGLSE